MYPVLVDYGPSEDGADVRDDGDDTDFSKTVPVARTTTHLYTAP